MGLTLQLLERETDYKEDFCLRYFGKGGWELDVLRQVGVLLRDNSATRSSTRHPEGAKAAEESHTATSHPGRSEESNINGGMFRCAQHDGIVPHSEGAKATEESHNTTRHFERSEESNINGGMFRCAQHDGIVPHSEGAKATEESRNTTRHSERSEESNINGGMFRCAQHDGEEQCAHSIQHDEMVIDASKVLLSERQYCHVARGYTYIVSNKTDTTLYIGVTNDLKRRIYEHKNHLYGGFTDKYNCEKLVYFEAFTRIGEAIAREKHLKGKSRIFKDDLINRVNPDRVDLYAFLLGDVSPSAQHDEIGQQDSTISHPGRSEESDNTTRHSERSEESNNTTRHSERSEESNINGGMFRCAQHDGIVPHSEGAKATEESRNGDVSLSAQHDDIGQYAHSAKHSEMGQRGDTATIPAATFPDILRQTKSTIEDTNQI